MLKRDDALKTVVKFTTTIYSPTTQNNQPIVDIGTGFFMKRDEVERLFIITANHVTKSFNQTTTVEMMGKNNTIIKVQLSVLQNNMPIINHTTADVSAIEIDPIVFNSLGATITVFGTSLINIGNIKSISRDAELTCIGFPNGLGVGPLFEPLSFRSHPSSNIIPSFVGLDGGYVSDIFVLENPSCGGYSGCPVLDLGYISNAVMTQTYSTAFYGLMHGTIADNTGGKMAVVTPAYYILQLI